MSSGSVTVTDTTHSTSKDTGAIIVTTGGLGVEANVHSTNVFATSHIGVGTTATSNTFDVRGTANVGALVTTSTHVSDSTQSTSTTTGALQVTGGVGIQGEVHSSNIFSASDTDGKSILGRVALGSLGVSGTSDQAAFSHIDMASASNFAVKQSALGTTHVNAKSGQHIRLSIGASEKARLTSDGDFYVNTDTLYVDASESRIGIKTISPGQPLDVRGAANVGVLTVTSGSVTDVTHSTSKDTGVLVITRGGLGVESNIHSTNVFATSHIGIGTTATSNTFDVRGTANVGALVTTSTHISDTTTSTTTTTGALKVAGGVGIVENLNVGGDLKVDTSVLVVNSTSNRVGINKATPGFTLDVDGDINFSGTFYEDGVAFVSTPWTIETSPNALSYIAGNVGIGEATPDAKLHVTGNAFVSTNLYASNVYTSGGLITNTAGTAKKTYSHTGTLPTNASVANATFGIVFSNHVFQAKIYAVLVEATATVSSITQECCGGHLTGGTPGTITVGTTNVIGQNGYPWDTVVASNGTTVTIKAKQVLVGAGNYNIFVEYLSAHADGKVLKFTEGGSDEITFNY
jgi:hypothetical protein